MPLVSTNREHGWTPLLFLIFLGFFYFQPILDHAGRTEWLITLGVTAIFLPIYLGLFYFKPPVTYVLLGAMAVLGMALSRYNPGSSVFIIFCACFIPWVVCSTRWAYIALISLLAAIGIHAVVFHPIAGFWATSFIVALGAGGSNINFAERRRADDKLRMAHSEIEHLAKVAERERIARDLHDVLGHTLSLIIVKSTLAGKLIEKHPDAAKKEIADIEKVSRDAIAEIRGTLRGYATYKLSEELQRAKAALGSAGVELKSETSEVSLSPAQESVLALITREAVTNVVRHAYARNCWLKIASSNGDCVLEIQDDGRGGFQSEGNGVRGMRERVEALGGKLERDTSAGTRLRFEFPLSANGAH